MASSIAAELAKLNSPVAATNDGNLNSPTSPRAQPRQLECTERCRRRRGDRDGWAARDVGIAGGAATATEFADIAGGATATAT
jgi:hypothetical protein